MGRWQKAMMRRSRRHDNSPFLVDCQSNVEENEYKPTPIQKLKCILHEIGLHKRLASIQCSLVRQRQPTIVTTAIGLTGGNAAKCMMDVMHFPVRRSEERRV